MPLFVLNRPKNDPLYAKVLILTGVIGFSWLIIQGFSIGIRGWNFDWLTALFGKLDGRQFGMGYGGLFLASSFLFLLTQGIAARGAINGDVFVVSAIGFVIAIVGAFVFFPIVNMLMSAFITEDGSYSFMVFAGKFFDDRLWGLSCLTGPGRCGVAWNSLFLAICVGFLTTVLGLAFALVVTRSGFKYRRAVRALTILPIITPPFVIGLALILMFGFAFLLPKLKSSFFIFIMTLAPSPCDTYVSIRDVHESVAPKCFLPGLVPLFFLILNMR